MKRNFYPLVKLAFYLFAFFVSSQLYGQMHIYTAPNGSSTADGTSASAPVNLARARAIAKANPQKAITIDLANGIYPQLTLDATDSRSASAPVVYSSAAQGGAIFQPTITLTTANFSPIPANIQARIINATAKTKVVQMSLASFNSVDSTITWTGVGNVTVFGESAASGFPRWAAAAEYANSEPAISRDRLTASVPSAARSFPQPRDALSRMSWRLRAGSLNTTRAKGMTGAGRGRVPSRHARDNRQDLGR